MLNAIDAPTKRGTVVISIAHVPGQLLLEIKCRAGPDDGKELAANAIHEFNPRSTARLHGMNCAVIPGNLLEAELFGRKKGAFTATAPGIQRRLLYGTIAEVGIAEYLPEASRAHSKRRTTGVSASVCNETVRNASIRGSHSFKRELSTARFR